MNADNEEIQETTKSLEEAKESLELISQEEKMLYFSNSTLSLNLLLRIIKKIKP